MYDLYLKQLIFPGEQARTKTKHNSPSSMMVK